MSGIWIRTQDKKRLVKCEDIEACNTWIYVSTNGVNCGIGVYSTREKALKVLDMIQKHIEVLEIKETDNNVNYHKFKQVFEMPKDYEV